MIYWIIYFSLSMGVFVFSQYVRDEDQKKLLIFYCTFLWMFGSFRYMVGTDFYNYMMIYQNPPQSIDELFDSRYEPMFTVCVMLLNYCEFSSQALFVVMESLTLFFFVKGVNVFVDDYREKLFIVILYAVFSLGFYWTFNAVRQVAAMSILLYSAKYILARKFLKFNLCVLLAMSFHYMAIVFVWMYFIYDVRINKKIVIVLLLLSVVAVITGYNFKVITEGMISVFSVTGLYYGYAARGLEYILTDGGISNTTIAFILFYVFSMMFFYERISADKKISVLFLSALVYLLVRIFVSLEDTSTSYLSSTIGRVAKYWGYFFILYIGRCLYFIRSENRQIFLLLSIVFIFVFSFQVMNEMIYIDENYLYDAYPEGVINNLNYSYNIQIFK